MRSLISLLLTVLATTAAAVAQANNYGLTVATRGNTAGQSCNTGSCQLDAIGTFPNSQVDVTVWGNPGSLYALAVSGQGLTCQPVPGVINLAMLGNNPQTLAVGRIPPGQSQIGDCGTQQFGVLNRFTVPPGAATLVFRLQAVAIGGAPNPRIAFTGAIDMTVF